MTGSDVVWAVFVGLPIAVVVTAWFMEVTRHGRK
jgi:hypothetical protein